MHCALKRGAMCGSPEMSKANRWSMPVNDSRSMAKSNLNLNSEPQNVFFLQRWFLFFLACIIMLQRELARFLEIRVGILVEFLGGCWCHCTFFFFSPHKFDGNWQKSKRDDDMFVFWLRSKSSSCVNSLKPWDWFLRQTQSSCVELKRG